MRTRAFGVALVVSLCFTSTVVAQQGTAEIGGKVSDQQGGVLPGVAIVVTNEDTGVFREVVTNANGTYFVPQIIPGSGRYRVTAKMEGFRSLERRGIHDTNIDADRNGVLFDPLPAGTYSGTSQDSLQNVEYQGGRNGAYGPGFVQLDMRAGYRARIGARRTFDVFVEVFNVTNKANFTNPSGDRRNTADFLRLATLVATSGLPRQAQIGLRLGF